MLDLAAIEIGRTISVVTRHRDVVLVLATGEAKHRSTAVVVVGVRGAIDNELGELLRTAIFVVPDPIDFSINLVLDNNVLYVAIRLIMADEAANVEIITPKIGFRYRMVPVVLGTTNDVHPHKPVMD